MTTRIAAAALAACLCLPLSAIAQDKPSPVIDSRVGATLHMRGAVVQSVGFSFPRNAKGCDHIQFVDFLRSVGGTVHWDPGCPHGEVFAQFRGVDTEDQANAKIAAIMPALSDLAAGLEDHR